MSDLIKEIEEIEDYISGRLKYERGVIERFGDLNSTLKSESQIKAITFESYLATLQRAREELTPPDLDTPKTIYLLEEDDGNYVWCEDPDPDGEERRVFEYRLVDEWVDVAEDKDAPEEE